MTLEIKEKLRTKGRRVGATAQRRIPNILPPNIWGKFVQDLKHGGKAKKHYEFVSLELSGGLWKTFNRRKEGKSSLLLLFFFYNVRLLFKVGISVHNLKITWVLLQTHRIGRSVWNIFSSPNHLSHTEHKPALQPGPAPGELSRKFAVEIKDGTWSILQLEANWPQHLLLCKLIDQPLAGKCQLIQQWKDDMGKDTNICFYECCLPHTSQAYIKPNC